MNPRAAEFGTAPLAKLLRQQAIPASVGILVMAIYGIVDTIFIGNWIDAYAIGAVTVVLPLQFLIASIGMAIGVGGSSIISRALGQDNEAKAEQVFANQTVMLIGFALLFLIFGLLFMEEILWLFGAKGKVTEPAIAYFHIILLGIPFLSWAMMSNSVIRAEGYPRVSMFILLIPAILNIILDPIFIIWLDGGIEGAAWATSLSFVASAAYSTYFFIFGKSELRIRRKNLPLQLPIVREILSIGSVTLARQGVISVLSIVLNNSLMYYGGEVSLSIYGIINRIMLFANFPVLGITQGFVPIAGFNYGARLIERVKKVIRMSIVSATLFALAIFTLIMAFTPQIASVFTKNEDLVALTTPALRLVFLATPLIAINMIVSAYYQAIGKALPALLLTLCKQGFILIPLILLFPLIWGEIGIWIAFPVADALTAFVSYYFFVQANRKLKLIEKTLTEENKVSNSTPKTI